MDDRAAHRLSRVHAFQEQIQGHWLAPIFPTLALAAAAAAETAGPRWAPLASLVLPVGIAGMVVGLVASLNPGNVIPPQSRCRADHPRLGHASAAEAEQLRKQSGADWVATTYYGVYGELAYHLAGRACRSSPSIERARYAYAPPPDPALARQAGADRRPRVAGDAGGSASST